MTSEEITRTIAEFGGWTCVDIEAWNGCCDGSHIKRPLPPYASLDDLQPVLAKFTPEMKDELGVKMGWLRYEETKCVSPSGFWAITLPASTLSRLIAETIKGDRAATTFEPSTEGSKP